MGVVSATPRPLYSRRKRPGTHCIKAGLAPGPVWTGAENLALTRIFFSLCTLSVLLCPGFAFCPYCTTHTTQTAMPPAGFEPAIPASDRPQTFVLNRSATGIGNFDPRTVQSVASGYTDHAVAAGMYKLMIPCTVLYRCSVAFINQ